MQFLVDAALPRAVADLLIERGHHAIHVNDAALGTSPDDAIAAYAREHRLTIVTADFDFADVRAYPPRAYRGIVVLTLPRRRDLLLIMLLVREFLDQLGPDASLDGKLVIVELGRIRVRE